MIFSLEKLRRRAEERQNAAKKGRYLAGLELPIYGHKSHSIQDLVRLRKMPVLTENGKEKKCYTLQAKHT